VEFRNDVGRNSSIHFFRFGLRFGNCRIRSRLLFSSSMNNRLGALLMALLAICLFFTFRVPEYGFVSARNLSLLMIDFAITATLAIGMLVVILPGHIDLSAGSGVGLTGGIAAVAATHPIGIGSWIVAPLSWLGESAARLGESTKWSWIDGAGTWLSSHAISLRTDLAVLFTLHPWLKPVLAMAGAVLVALILWRIMGHLIIRHRIPAFIITLGALLIFKGLFWQVIESHTVPIGTAADAGVRQVSVSLAQIGGPESVPIFEYSGNAYATLTTGYFLTAGGWTIAGLVSFALVIFQLRSRAKREEHGFAVDDGELTFLKLFIALQLIALFVLVTTQYRGLPLSVVILGLVAFAVWLLTQHTPWGRYLYAIGGNEEAAVISGIPVERVVLGAFTLMGAIVALTGLMQTAYLGSSTTTVGELMELDAVAACVIGGTSLKGGRGSVLGVLFGALIMACLINGLILMAVRPEVKFIARGAVLIAAVWMDVKLTRVARAT
jgi:D-xylose transport system permease protein